MSDFGSLRLPTPGTPQNQQMGSAPIGRASSPIGSNTSAASRYSLGGMGSAANKLGSDQILRKAQQGQDNSQGIRAPSAATFSSLNQAPSTPHARFGPRPSSEMIGIGGAAGANSEADAIDKWFEDLQHYEATLEEMAAASLDQNFKEELGAIEQWFRVLSEAERTAALYSLLQESTQVQIRFFITVLQQMSRSDPMSALLSPGQNTSMAEQMEAKLASLGLKSPTAAKGPQSPSHRPYNNRQSEAFLSPASAHYSPSPAGGDAAATLAAQRAKLKANRVSAPGTFTGEQRNFAGSLDQVQERTGSPNPSGDLSRSPGLDQSGLRPKSIDILSSAGTGTYRSPRHSGLADEQLSPIPSSGNWSSMVNTPLTNLYDDPVTAKGRNGEANVNLDATSSQLASLGDNGRVVLDQDVSKYQRRKSGQPDSQQGGGSGVGRLSPNLGSGGWSGAGGLPQNDLLRQAGQFNNFQTMSPNSFAALQSPSGGFGNGMNMQMMNTMAAMGGLNNANAAQFLAMQQQILQNQQQIAAMTAAAQQQQQRGAGSSRGTGLSPPLNPLAASGRRSPAVGQRPQAPPKASTAAAGGGGEEEVPDVSVLSDIPAWLRHLRLHKYTPNFESCEWKEMAVMTDTDLQDKGVAALGARRKLLKTFRAVREKHGLKGADDAEKPGDGLAAAPGSAGAVGGDKVGGEAVDATETT